MLQGKPNRRETLDILLKLLRREDAGRIVSGALLSEVLGISRTAVWKRVKQLRGRGYEIESTPSAGYRFISAPDKLLPEEIRDGLKTRTFGRVISYLEQTDSTNRVAGELARQGADHGTLVAADAQTHGKGRLGRSWISPPGCGLYLSLILRPPIHPSVIPLITLVAAVSLCESLNLQTALGVQVKWPNDLWIAGKKVGGILTEMSADMDQVRHVILGIGINVNLSLSRLPSDLRDRTTSLSRENGRPLNRVALLRGLLDSLEHDYDLFCEKGFKPFRRRWAGASMTFGRSVRVQMPQGVIRGVAHEIDERGGLRIETENGRMEAVLCGDVAVVMDDNIAGDEKRKQRRP